MTGLNCFEWNAGSNIWAFNMRWRNELNIQQTKIPYFLFRSPTSFAQFSVIFVLNKIEDEYRQLSRRAHRHEDSKHLGHYPITINPSLNTPNNNALDWKETIRDALWPWLESSACVVERERAAHHLLMAWRLQSKPSDPTLNTQEITRSWSASVTTLLTTAISDWDWDGQSIPLYSGDANIVELTAVSERLWEQVNFSCSQSHSTTCMFPATSMDAVLSSDLFSEMCSRAYSTAKMLRRWSGLIECPTMVIPRSDLLIKIDFMMSLILPHVALFLWLRGRDKVLDRTCCARLCFSTQLPSTMMQKRPYTAL